MPRERGPAEASAGLGADGGPVCLRLSPELRRERVAGLRFGVHQWGTAPIAAQLRNSHIFRGMAGRDELPRFVLCRAGGHGKDEGLLLHPERRASAMKPWRLGLSARLCDGRARASQEAFSPHSASTVVPNTALCSKPRISEHGPRNTHPRQRARSRSWGGRRNGGTTNVAASPFSGPRVPNPEQSPRAPDSTSGAARRRRQ